MGVRDPGGRTVTAYPRRRAGMLFLVYALVQVGGIGAATTLLVRPAIAQSATRTELRVNVVRELSFGYAAVGAPGSGAPSDTGVFEILGSAGDEVDVVFALPQVLESVTGSRLSLFFDAMSGAYSVARSGADRLPFDPRLRQRFRIPSSGRFVLLIEARAVPPRAQDTGRYRANVVVFVSPIP